MSAGSYAQDWANGAVREVTTFLPSEITDTEAKQFTDGKLPEPPPEAHRYFTAKHGSRWRQVPTPDTNQVLVEIIEGFLTADEGRVCLFEDAVARADDPWLSSADTRVLTFKDEVYHFLSRTDDRERIIKTIRRATTEWQSIAVMTHIRVAVHCTHDPHRKGSHLPNKGEKN